MYVQNTCIDLCHGCCRRFDKASELIHLSPSWSASYLLWKFIPYFCASFLPVSRWKVQFVVKPFCVILFCVSVLLLCIENGKLCSYLVTTILKIIWKKYVSLCGFFQSENMYSAQKQNKNKKTELTKFFPYFFYMTPCSLYTWLLLEQML